MPREIKVKREAEEHLIKAQELFEQGDYAGSLKKNQEVLSLCEDIPPGDEALFNAGLIYAHYGYPKKDYKESLDLFKRLVQVFPESPLAEQARILIEMLQEKERLKKKIDELGRIVKQAEEENERLKREIEELTKTIEDSKQVDIEIDEKKKELSK